MFVTGSSNLFDENVDSEALAFTLKLDEDVKDVGGNLKFEFNCWMLFRIWDCCCKSSCCWFNNLMLLSILGELWKPRLRNGTHWNLKCKIFCLVACGGCSHRYGFLIEYCPAITCVSDCCYSAGKTIACDLR